MKKSILSSTGGVRYTGPIARKPDEPGGRRNQTLGSRPVLGQTKTPSSDSADKSGFNGRKTKGAL